MKYQFITVEGNIGAGKTTLSHLLARHYNARLVLEEFADNPFLGKFYDNPSQYAFPLELFFMAERYKQLKDLLMSQDLFKRVTISDYLFTKCLLFAKVNLPEEEYRLHAPVSRLKENIRKRNRPYELNIGTDYLFTLQETYLQYIRQHNVTTLIVDVSNADFLGNEKHLKVVLDALDKDYESGQHYLTLPD
jgi:deoxyguanosine kinase